MQRQVFDLSQTRNYFTLYILFIASTCFAIMLKGLLILVKGVTPDRKFFKTLPTQLPFINRYMFLQSFVLYVIITIASLLQRETLSYRQYLIQLYIPYFMGIFSYYLTNYLLDSYFNYPFHYDISGHLLCGIITASQLLSGVTFLSIYETLVNRVLKLICFVMIGHLIYSLFFTAFMYHTSLESLVGLLLGISISVFIYSDTFLSTMILTIGELCFIRPRQEKYEFKRK